MPIRRCVRQIGEFARSLLEIFRKPGTKIRDGATRKEEGNGQRLAAELGQADGLLQLIADLPHDSSGRKYAGAATAGLFGQSFDSVAAFFNTPDGLRAALPRLALIGAKSRRARLTKAGGREQAEHGQSAKTAYCRLGSSL